MFAWRERRGRENGCNLLDVGIGLTQVVAGESGTSGMEGDVG
jgi:hypothetical protein